MEPFPVDPSIEVLAGKTYVRNQNRWVAMLVVRTQHGTDLKFYKWKRKEEQWKVDLSRFLVRDIDLCQVAADSLELARKFGISLKWPSLDQISKVHVSIHNPPSCRKCGTSINVQEYGTISVWRCGACGDSWRT